MTVRERRCHLTLMQNRYAGDIGDYVKLALLRSIGYRRKTGVCWYLYPDESHNTDGRHVAYLAAPETWRHLDSELFDQLADTVTRSRNVRSLEWSLPAGTVFHSQPISTSVPSAKARCEARTTWFDAALRRMTSCDLVFADPDNGIVNDDPARRNKAKFGKQIPLSEVHALSSGRTAIIYHHNSRFKGGHDAEVNKWIDLIDRPAIAVRATAYSCRTFFIVNPTDDIVDRASDFCERWKDHKVRLHTQ